MFDVEHGFCALITTEENYKILIECGHNSSTNFTPTKYLEKVGISTIQELWVSNYDEDHISNLSELKSKISIKALWRNKSVTAEQLELIKSKNKITENMKTLIKMMNDYTGDYSRPVPKSYEVSIDYNNYPEFEDTNNLSAVFFFNYRDIRILYAGDMETKGWENLLKKQSFIEKIKKSNIFIASHHGRDNGYCPELFDHFKPEVILISDKEIVHGTQNQLYTKHASGVIVDGTKRFVLTTRNDGRIGIRQSQSSNREIYIG